MHYFIMKHVFTIFAWISPNSYIYPFHDTSLAPSLYVYVDDHFQMEDQLVLGIFRYIIIILIILL